MNVLTPLILAAAVSSLPAELDRYLENALKEWNIPGAAIAIVRDGKVVVAKGYGVREQGKPARVDEHTVFDIASLSKSFTSAAAATLVDEGKMKWDDPVRRHLPAFELIDPMRTNETTIRDLLAHRTGVEPGNFMFRFSDYDTAEVVRRARFMKVRAPFRTDLVYNNVVFSIAGEAIAAAAGMSFDDVVRRRLLAPLGMRETTIGIEHTKAGDNVAMPHARVGDRHLPIRNKKAMAISPAGGLNSTAADMARWLLFQLGDGTWEGKRIVSTAALDETHAPQQIIATTREMREARGVRYFGAYGLGWQVMDYHGHPMNWHSGNHDGMPVYMAILPKEKLGVLVMLNTWESGTLHGSLAARILDTMLGRPPKDHAGELRKAWLAAPRPGPPTPIPNTTASLPLTGYAGTYNDPLYGDIAVREENGKLVLQFAGDELADLTHWHHDVFRVVWRDPVYAEYFSTFAAFSLSAKGEAVRLDMKLNRDDVAAVRRLSPRP